TAPHIVCRCADRGGQGPLAWEAVHKPQRLGLHHRRARCWNEASLSAPRLYFSRVPAPQNGGFTPLDNPSAIRRSSVGRLSIGTSITVGACHSNLLFTAVVMGGGSMSSPSGSAVTRLIRWYLVARDGRTRTASEGAIIVVTLDMGCICTPPGVSDMGCICTPLAGRSGVHLRPGPGVHL